MQKKILVLLLLIGFFSFTSSQLSYLNSLEGVSRDYSGIIFLYSHGIADTKDQVKNYVDANIIHYPFLSFDYADSVKHSSLVDIKKNIYNSFLNGWYRLTRGVYKNCALAQESDIQQLKHHYDYIRENWPQAKIILYGMSRGASTINTFMGTHTVENVVAVITESGFDTVGSIVNQQINNLGIQKIVSQKTGEKVIELLFCKYNRQGISPVQLAKNIDTTIPHLIICSKKDALVPAQCGSNMYKAFCNNGHKKVHLFVTNDGAHGKIIHSSQRALYQKIVHAFYKNYDLPHDSCLAHDGDKLFHTLQPNIS